MGESINPLEVIPTKKSGTAEWTAFYDALVKTYGKNRASTAFAITWRKHRGEAADVAKVRTHTKLPLDNESVMDSISSVGEGAFGVLDGMGTILKVGVGITTTFVVIVAGVLVYKLAKASASDIGTATGVAAKVYTGKP